MRLQGMSIVFALVCLPIILVIAYYLSLQIKTINLQNQYNSKLLDATYDAMSAFELNTANEDLSTVSDSLRTIIEASDNIFMNALSTNFGMSNASKSHLEPFIPAILYTLYDGYYIYAPTYAPTVVTDSDGNAVSVGDLGVTANGDGTYNYTEYKKKINTTTHLEEDIPRSDTNSVSYSSLVNKSDYGQLLYYTPKTVKKDTNTDTIGLEYSNCTTSIEAASSFGETDPKKAQYKTQNVLKSYMPYSARYVQDIKDSEGKDCKADLNVINTLDNYVTIEGSFTYPDVDTPRKIYYTKSGYLVPFTGDSLSVRFSVYGDSDADYAKSLDYSENEIQEYIETGRPIKVQVLKNLKDPSSWETIIEISDIGENKNNAVIDKTNTNTDSDSSKLTRYENALFALEEAIKNPTSTPDDITNAQNNATNLLTADGVTISGDIANILRLKINDIKYRMQLNSSAIYYAKAAIFSKWVKDNLSGLEVKSIHDISGLNYTTYIDEFVRQATGDDYKPSNMWDSDDKVFEFTNGTENRGSTEIKPDSTFYNHKMEIIRTSIQYNLNLSMSSYNRHLYYNDDQSYEYNKNTDYTMPIMKQSEWDQILSNISIVSFMQGMDCGLKQYNNYVVVSSSNNEIMTTTDNIYYANKDEFNDENSEYHKYNCKKVFNKIKDGADIENPEQRMSFTSKEVKYDKISTRSTVIPYRYDHKNLACYECINDGNYKGEEIFESGGDEDAKYALRKAYYIGVGKERNDVYKMNAVDRSEGYEILYFDGRESMVNSANINTKEINSKLGMNKIKSIELVFGAVTTERRDEASLTFKINYKGRPLKEQTGTTESLLYSIPTNTTNRYTWNVEVDSHITDTNAFNLGNLIFELVNADTSSFVPEGGNPSEKLKNSIVAIRVIYK